MSAKLYIAGKITGDPDYKAKFEAAQQVFEKQGFLVLNPTWMPQGLQPADYMRMCFAMIDAADVVAFLPGYELSPGAQLELQYCFYTDKATKLPPKREDPKEIVHCKDCVYLVYDKFCGYDVGPLYTSVTPEETHCIHGKRREVDV